MIYKIEKTLLFILIFVLILILCNCNVYAVNSFIAPNGNSYNYPDYTRHSGYDYYFVYAKPSGNNFQISVIESTVPLYIKYLTSSSQYQILNKPSPDTFSAYRYYLTTPSTTWTDYNKKRDTTIGNSWDFQNCFFIDSNYDIYIYNNNNYNDLSLYYSPVPPESYGNYPYFLNSEADIAIGEQDLIIMPRRLS